MRIEPRRPSGPSATPLAADRLEETPDGGEHVTLIWVRRPALDVHEAAEGFLLMFALPGLDDERDLTDMPEDVRERLQWRLVDRVDQVLEPRREAAAALV